MEQFYRALEQSSLRTWATLHTYTLQGLALRTANGYTKRSNSVSVLNYDGDLADIQHIISQCEAYYHTQQLPAIVKITEDEISASFDRELEQQRYDKCDISLVQWLRLDTYASNHAAIDQSIQKIAHHFHPDNKYNDERVGSINNAATSKMFISSTQTDCIHQTPLQYEAIVEWIKLAGSIGDMSEQAQQMIPQLLQASQCPYAGVIVYVEGQPAACALAVCDGEFVGIYDVMTGEAYRRRGLARHAVHTLLNWGKQMGAQYAYLQVIADNEPACKLYEQLGFQHGYRYWYRVENV